MGLGITAIDRFVLNTSSRFCCLLHLKFHQKIFLMSLQTQTICGEGSQAGFYRSFGNDSIERKS